MRVSLSNSDRSFSVDPDRPVLEGALSAGLNLPHSCKGGNCGACRARLLDGTVHYPHGRPLGLTDAQAAEGFILLCQARALEDLTVENVEVSFPESVVIKRVPARIERTELLSHDVLGVFLRLPAAAPLSFEPGQYLDIMLSGGRRRSFSIASPPHDSRLLELHVRRVPDGEWTGPLFADPGHGSLLAVEGPLGRFVFRADSSAPMLLVGGGTGFAPLKSILRHVIENSLERDMVLYWGVRSERDLYAHAELLELSGRAPNFRYHAVLSEPGDRWTGRRGWVHEAVLADFATLGHHDVYASGPPAMIASIQRDFPRHGARPDRLFYDSFDYAPDALERHRLTAAKRS